MSADAFPPGQALPRPQRLVTTSEAAVLLQVDEGTLWRLLDESGIRVHVLVQGRDQRVAVSVRDLLYLRAHPELRSRGPRALADEQGVGEDGLGFELDLLSAQHENAKARIASLEQHQRENLEELDRLRRDLEFERGQRLQQEILKSHLARVGEQLAAGQERLSALEGRLAEVRAEHERELGELETARAAERAYQSRERERLSTELARVSAERDELRRAVLAGQAEREALMRELSVARDLERATQRYCDRLEARLRGG